MSFSKQVVDARNSSIANISGTCASGSSFLERLNDVTEQLLRRGNWYGTEILARFCIHNCRVTYPRWVGTVLGLRFCRGHVSIPKNNWSAIVGPYTCGWSSCDVTTIDDNPAPIYNEITGSTGKYIRYHVVKNEDIGKTITVYGTQYGGQPLQELVDGVWQMGLTLTAASPYVQSTVLVTKITSVVRQATQGMTYLYQVDATSGDLIDLAVYEPNETRPQYRRHMIKNMCGTSYYTDDNDRRIRTVDALIKLEFTPYVNENDFLLIDDFQALKYGFQAYQLDEANDDDGADRKWMRAISELNMDIRNKNPAMQTTVQIQSGCFDGVLTSPI